MLEKENTLVGVCRFTDLALSRRIKTHLCLDSVSYTGQIFLRQCQECKCYMRLTIALPNKLVFLTGRVYFKFQGSWVAFYLFTQILIQDTVSK